jgi:hypothetical protein
MSNCRLPQPEHWPPGWQRYLQSRVLLAIYALAALLLGAADLTSGLYAGALMEAGLLTSLALAIFVLTSVTSGRTTVHVEHGSTGTTFTPDRNVSRLGLVSLALFVVTSVIVIVGTWGGRPGILFDIDIAGQAVAVAIPAALAATWMLIHAWSRGGIGQVRMTPGGIDHFDVRRTVTVAWDDIAAISDQVDRRILTAWEKLQAMTRSVYTAPTRKTIVLHLRDGRRRRVDDAELYVPDGAGLYWLVRHYLRNPDDRTELADGRAVDRLADGRFDTSEP